MLIVRNEQLETFSAHLFESFTRDTLFRLRKKFPVSTKTMSDKTLTAQIEEGIIRAENYKIHEKEDIKIFIEYMIYLGKDFDSNPDLKWASKILRIRNISGSEKISRLQDENPLIQEFE